MIAGGRFGTHGLGRLELGGAPHGEHRPHRRGQQAGRGRLHHGHGLQAELQIGEAIELGVDGGQLPAQPHPEDDAGKDAGADDGRHQFQIMSQHRTVAVAEGLEGGDLFALHGHHAPDHHVEQKGGDAQEQGGKQAGQGAELLQFLGQETVGSLILTVVGAQAAVGIEQSRRDDR